MSDFIKFRNALQKQFDRLAKNGNTLFVSSVSKDDVWNAYLDAFPEGTNEIYKTNREYDCNCCKSFIRYVGRVLAEVDGKVVSIWDFEAENEYATVCKALAKLNKDSGISGIFLHEENTIGADHNFKIIPASADTEASTVRFNHFYQVLPAHCYSLNGDIGARKGSAQTQKSSLQRSLQELTPESVEVVLELIEQNSIYRGSEHLSTVRLIQKMQKELSEATDKDLYLWKQAVKLGGVCNLRGTVIGTLLVDISNGVDVDQAVRSFELKVAPQNYKRTTAIVTDSMRNAAKQKVKDLGLENSFVRRHAQLSDISVNDVLFADRSALKVMEDSIFDAVPVAKNATKIDSSKVTEIGYEDFITKVLPKAETVEVFLEGKNKANLVTLVAPTHASAPCIMKWGNNFSWAYNGDATDSYITERVKAQGGIVDAPFRVSLSWDNSCDLDLHLQYQNRVTDEHVYFCYRTGSTSKMELDVDMRGMEGYGVENIYSKSSKLADGTYKFYVHNFNYRSGGTEGMKVEVKYGSEFKVFEFPNTPRDRTITDIFTMTVKGGVPTFDFEGFGTHSEEVWGVSTGAFHKVSTVMYSPNYWDNSAQVGNKHVFFMLEGCKNPDPVRGFYNEFLPLELNEHRKVFEMLGAALKAPYQDEQLSGVGFSTTKKDHVLVKVTGSHSRMLKVIF